MYDSNIFLILAFSLNSYLLINPSQPHTYHTRPNKVLHIQDSTSLSCRAGSYLDMAYILPHLLIGQTQEGIRDTFVDSCRSCNYSGTLSRHHRKQHIQLHTPSIQSKQHNYCNSKDITCIRLWRLSLRYSNLFHIEYILEINLSKNYSY